MRRDWWLTATEMWHMAMGIRRNSGLRDITAAVEGFMTLAERPPVSAVEALVLRGYALELAWRLRQVRGAIPAGARRSLALFCRSLEAPVISERQAACAGELLNQIVQASARPQLDLASQIRQALDRNRRGRMSVAEVARTLGTNTRYVERAMRRAGDVTISTYQRRRQLEIATDSLRRGQPVKVAAAQAGCSEATLRRLLRAATGLTPREVRLGTGGEEPPRGVPAVTPC